MSLQKKTNNWVEQNIISAEQAQAILNFEKNKHTSLFWRVSFSIAGLLIGQGIILLVASNWQYLSELTKLAGAFILLGGLSYTTYRQWQQQHKGWTDFFAILSFLMIGATIGLISQIFNLDGGWHSFALGWTLLGLPFLWVSRSLFFHLVWLILFVSACHIEKVLEHCFDSVQLSMLSTLILLCLSYAGGKLHESFGQYTRLPQAFEKLTIWSAYLFVWEIATLWGLRSNWFGGENIANTWMANAFIFAFAAWRMFLAIRTANITSFKRNALLTEIYIFLLFVCGVKDLFMSGIGFILGGLFVLGLIYILRKTVGYIKQMEAFK